MRTHLSHYLLYFTAILALFVFPRQIHAQMLFQDDFSDGDISDWTVVRNLQWGNASLPCTDNGQPAVWQVLLQRMGISIYGPGCFTEIIPSSFRLSGSQSYAYDFDITMPESMAMDRNYTLRYVDQQNTLAMKIIGNQIYLEKLAQGRGWSVPGGSATYPFIENKTYRIRNEVRGDNTVKVFIDGQLVLNFSDIEPYLSGGTIGFRASVGAFPHSVTWFDNVAVTSLDVLPPPLTVPYYSQRNAQWKNQLYDRADQWSPLRKTIEDWGCAITSMTMILRYHNILTTPNGAELTPSSLNQWLLSQPDGYIGDGFVNWIAITRMVMKYHAVHPDVPALEYRRAFGDVGTISNEISEKHPLILELPGHFVVGKGILPNDSISIHDPYSTQRTSLTSTDTILSSRTFHPSFTNLSYILIAYNSQTHLTIDHAGSVGDTYTELPFINQETQNSSQKPLSIQQIPTPEDGTYELHVSQDVPDFYAFTVYAYDRSGDVTVLPIEGFTGQDPQVYLLTYSQNSPSTIQKQLQQYSLFQLIERLRNSGNLRHTYTYYRLKEIAQYVSNSFFDLEKKRRYLNLFSNEVMRLQQHLDQRIQKLLLDEVTDFR